MSAGSTRAPAVARDTRGRGAAGTGVPWTGRRKACQLLPVPRWVAPITVAALLFAAAAHADGEAELAPDELEEDVGCDASAGGDVAELVEDQPEDRTLPTPLPIRWRPSEGPECHRFRGRRMCEGPRRVPEPFGPAAEFAARLGIDERQAPRILMNGPPPRAWVEAAEGSVGPGLLWPVPEGRLWRGYGRHRPIARTRRTRGRRVQHNGVDIGAPEGAAIRAVNDGLVVYSFNGMRGYGNAVLLLHPDGTVTLYGHCRATYVFAGQRVRRGQVIAEVGQTGLAHGAHLHFEWRRDDVPLDPRPHFVGREPAETEEGEADLAAAAP